MPAVGNLLPTMLQIAKGLDPDGMMAHVVNALARSTAAFMDCPMYPSNAMFSHRSSRLIGLPTVYKRRFNSGVLKSRSTKEQVEEGMSLYEAWTASDKKLADSTGDAAGFRAQECEAFWESMGQSAGTDIYYADPTDDPLEFQGIVPRYSVTTGNIGKQVLSCLGTGGNLTSAYLIGWGENKVFGLHPKNTVAGIQHFDHGDETVQLDNDIAGSVMRAYVDQFTLDFGISVKDPRYIVRVCDIDVSAVLAVSGNQALTAYATNIINMMSRAVTRLGGGSGRRNCNPVFYFSRALYEAFDIQMLARTLPNVFKTIDIEGEYVETFRGIPIKIDDSIIDFEDEVDLS